MPKPSKEDRATFRHIFDGSEAGEGPFHVKGGEDAEVIVVGNPDTWKRVSTPCAKGKHDPVLDPTEKSIEGYVGYKCRRCKIGWIVPKPVNARKRNKTAVL